MEKEQMDALRAQVREQMDAHNFRMRQVSNASGVAYSTLSAWLNDTYTGDNLATAEKMTRWVESMSARERVRAATPIVPGFIMTRTAKRFMAIMESAQYEVDMGLVSGNAGVGKTMAIEAYAAQNNNVWVVTADPTMTSPSAVLDELMYVVGCHERGGRKIRILIRRLVGTQGLIVVDEAQHLTTRAIEQLRTIHDVAKIGLVLFGNLPLNEKIEGLGRTSEYAQLFSRIGLRRNVKQPLQSDMCPLLKEWGLKDQGVIDHAKAIGLREGGLRSMTKVLKNAVKMAQANGRDQVSMDDLERSFKEHMTGEFPKLRGLPDARGQQAVAAE